MVDNIYPCVWHNNSIAKHAKVRSRASLRKLFKEIVLFFQFACCVIGFHTVVGTNMYFFPWVDFSPD